MNDSVQVEYNSEYELIDVEKRKNDAQVGITLIRVVGKIVEWILTALFMLIALKFAVSGMVVGHMAGISIWIVLGLLISGVMLYALWRVQLVEDVPTRLFWTLAILTGVGAWVFLLIDPVNEYKKKLMVG